MVEGEQTEMSRKRREKVNAKLSRKSIAWIRRHINEIHPTIDSVVQMLIVEYEKNAGNTKYTGTPTIIPVSVSTA
jgi:hypothetical protein